MQSAITKEKNDAKPVRVVAVLAKKVGQPAISRRKAALPIPKPKRMLIIAPEEFSKGEVEHPLISANIEETLRQSAMEDVSRALEYGREVPKVDGSLAEKVLSKLPLEKAFHFYTGIDLPTEIRSDSLIDFCEKIRTTDMRSIEFHLSRGDFELWINYVGDTELAQQIRQARNLELKGEDLRKKLYDTLKTRCDELMTRCDLAKMTI